MPAHHFNIGWDGRAITMHDHRGTVSYQDDIDTSDDESEDDGNQLLLAQVVSAQDFPSRADAPPVVARRAAAAS